MNFKGFYMGVAMVFSIISLLTGIKMVLVEPTIFGIFLFIACLILMIIYFTMAYANDLENSHIISSENKGGKMPSRIAIIEIYPDYDEDGRLNLSLPFSYGCPELNLMGYTKISYLIDDIKLKMTQSQ